MLFIRTADADSADNPFGLGKYRAIGAGLCQQAHPRQIDSQSPGRLGHGRESVTPVFFGNSEPVVQGRWPRRADENINERDGDEKNRRWNRNETDLPGFFQNPATERNIQNAGGCRKRRQEECRCQKNDEKKIKERSFIHPPAGLLRHGGACQAPPRPKAPAGLLPDSRRSARKNPTRTVCSPRRAGSSPSPNRSSGFRR